MRTVDDFAAIRQAHRDGQSIRGIAQQLGVGRDAVRKALQHGARSANAINGRP
jgi:transposase-like protein